MQPALRNRLVFGPILLLVLVLGLWLDHAAEGWTRPWMQRNFNVNYGVGGIGLMLLLLIALPLATFELATMFIAERVQPYKIIASLGSSALLLHAFLTQFPPFQPIAASTLVFIIVGVMLLAALRRAWGRQTHEAITRMAGSVLATMYYGGLGWFLIAIRVKHSPDPDGYQGSTWVLLLILLTVKFTDIGAFFGGRSLGKHKLILWLSPGKTWEGLVCGIITAGAIAGILAHFFPIPNLDWHKGILFGAIIGAVGQLGDLLESLMKRDAEVKDSGNVVPGFGGVLDLTDSPLLAGPVAYLLFSLF